MCFAALLASPVDVHLVIFHDEAPGHQAFQVLRAAIHFKHPATFPATEVVVVPFSRQLVALRLTGNIHHGKGLALGQAFQGPVDRREPHVGHVRLGCVQNLLGREGAVLRREHLANRTALRGVTLHGRRILETKNENVLSLEGRSSQNFTIAKCVGRYNGEGPAGLHSVIPIVAKSSIVKVPLVAAVSFTLMLTGALSGCGQAASTGPAFLVTIPPLRMIVQEIVGPEDEVVSLLPAGASPHTFELRPSMARAAANARAIFFVDESIDGWAVRLSPDRLQSVFSMVPESMRLTYEADHVHADTHISEPAESGGEGAPPANAHFWLDPLTVQAVIPALVDALTEANPEGAERYKANGERFSEGLSKLQQEIETKRPEGTDYGLIAFHPSWDYFFHRFGISIAGYVEPFPGREPTPQAMKMMADALSKHAHRVVVSEVQLPDKPAEVLAGMLGATVTVLDPLGGNGDLVSYEALLRDNAARLWEAFR